MLVACERDTSADLSRALDGRFALREAREAMQRVIDVGEPVELLPQSAYVRRLQHELIAKHELESTTVGEPPRRRVRVLPP